MFSGIEEAEAAAEDIPNDIFDPLTTEITVAGITITPALVYIGTMLPENILIHIAQNAVNFFCSTLFWFFLMSVTQVRHSLTRGPGQQSNKS